MILFLLESVLWIFKFNITIVILLLILILVSLVFVYFYNFQNFFKTNFFFNLVKLLAYIILIQICVSQIFLWFYYFQTLNMSNNSIIAASTPFFKKNIVLYNYIIFENVRLSLFAKNFFFTIDLFGLIIQTIAVFVGFLSFSVLDTRFFFKNIKYLFIFPCFSIVVILFTIVNNILIFFIMYELLLLPSFLLVYNLSQSRRATQASLYFVIWTQFGSFLVLCGVTYMISLTNFTKFSDLKFFCFTYNEMLLLYTLFFFGFGFKVPIWPFHFWLTKTHVEASAGFSMYLSGFLVKTALYGFYKYTIFLGAGLNTTFFVVIAGVGVVDSSLKMFSQIDIKKLIAFCTVQEMNLIYLVLCWGDSTGVITAMLFSLTHAFLSAMMFYLVDCIQRRYNSRSVAELSGIIHTTPNLGIAIFVMSVLYAGIPGTMKFVCEFYLYSQLIDISMWYTILILIFANIIGVLGFCKCFFNILFGTSVKFTKANIIDLTIKDLFIIIFCVFFLCVMPILITFFF